jgi:hypothetical protein
VLENAKSWDSVVRQIELLARFASALGRAALADSLGEIAAQLRPEGSGDGAGNGGGGQPSAAKPDAGAATPTAATRGAKKPKASKKKK